MRYGPLSAASVVMQVKYCISVPAAAIKTQKLKQIMTREAKGTLNKAKKGSRVPRSDFRFPPIQTEQQVQEKKKQKRGKNETEESGDGGTERRSNNEDGAAGAAWKVAEAASCFCL